MANLIAVSASAFDQYINLTHRDGTSKVWDCNLGDEVGTYDFKGLPQDLHWNYSGSLFCVSTKDKMNRIFDPRENRVVGEWSPHDGTKCSKMAWLGDSPHVVTAGFNRTSQREYKLWDLRAARQATFPRVPRPGSFFYLSPPRPPVHFSPSSTPTRRFCTSRARVTEISAISR